MEAFQTLPHLVMIMEANGPHFYTFLAFLKLLIKTSRSAIVQESSDDLKF